MTSDDLKRFYGLYFEKGYHIENFTVSMSIDGTSKTKIDLFKDEMREVIISDEQDIAYTILKFNNVIKSDGSIGLAKIKDKRKYYDVITEFTENREGKIKESLRDLKERKSPLQRGFWHKFDQALVKLLFEKTSSNDSDLLWLKKNYFHFLAFYLDETKTMTDKTKDLLFAKSKDIRSAFDAADRILSNAFLPKNEKKNPVEIYRLYRQYLPDSLEDHSERIAIQLAYLEDLRRTLNKVGSQEKGIRILYVLDVYRRVYEMTLPILDLLRIALLLSKGETKVVGSSADDIIKVLDENGHSGFVEAFIPQIRHCESHLATRISEEKMSVFLTKREGLRRILINEYSFDEIVSHQRRLNEVIFPALYYAFSKFDGFLKLLLLDSFEYQLLLISKITT